MALYWSAISSIVILGNRPQNGANLGYAAPCDRTSPLKPKAGLNGPPAIELPTQAKSRLEWAIRVLSQMLGSALQRFGYGRAASGEVRLQAGESRVACVWRVVRVCAGTVQLQE